MRVQLLNGCQSAGKNFVRAPEELLYLSGQLARENIEFAVCDARAERLSARAVQERVADFRPNVCVLLSDSNRTGEDLSLLYKWQKESGFSICLIGNSVAERAREILSDHLFIDAIFHESFSPETVSFLQNSESKPKTISFRRNDGSLGIGNRIAISASSDADFISVPSPEFGRFPMQLYATPLSTRKPCTTMVTQTEFLQRSLANLEQEFEALAKQGIREICFMDNAFNLDENRLQAICESLIRQRYRFVWTCSALVESANVADLHIMRRAGCSGVRFFVSPTTNSQSLRRSIAIAKHCGLRVLLETRVGVEEEDKESAAARVADIIEFNADQVIFSADSDVDWQRRLVRHAYSQFYFRPGRLLRLASSRQRRKNTLVRLFHRT